MATVKKSKKLKKYDGGGTFGGSTSTTTKDGRPALVTKSITADGPRYYTSTHPSESTATMLNNIRVRNNSADSTRAVDVNPNAIKALNSYKTGGKLAKGKVAVKKKATGGKFPDLNKDGKVTKADVLKGRGVIAKTGTKMKSKAPCASCGAKMKKKK